MSRIDVGITVDTEFSLGTAFQAAGGKPIGEERVECRVGGRAWGLTHLLEVFGAHGLKATFFVETLQVAHFGDGPMGAVVERILAAGHDVQLHLHPQWLSFREAAGREWLDDNCEGRSEAELCDMIGMGMATFARWGAPAPIALRTGGLRADRTVYRAMAKMGLRLASNLGWALFEPEDAALRIAAGRDRVEGVLEVPVVTYRQAAVGPLRPLRLCTITATSRAEQRWLLDSAAAAAISPFIILTHPFEFVRYGGRPAPAAPSRINQARLEALCGLLAADERRFRTVTFAAAAADWAALPPARFPPLRVPVLATAARIAENALNDLRPWRRSWRGGLAAEA